MNGLLSEIALKRKNIENDTSRPSKYMRRGDIERLKEEQEAKTKQEELEKQKAIEAEAAAKKRAADEAKVCIPLELIFFSTLIPDSFEICHQFPSSRSHC